MVNEIVAERNKRVVVGIAKVGAVAIVGFVIAPVIFMIVQGIVGLVVAGVIGLSAIYFIPVLVDWLANVKLKGIKLIADKNPVETLQNDYIKRQEALNRFQNSIKDFSTAVMTFQDKLGEFKIKCPTDSDKFELILSKMKELLVIRKSKYRDADRGLQQYAVEIDKAKAIWEMSQEAAKVTKASGMNEEDILQKIRVETSLDSIQKSLNSSFAELETSLEKADFEKSNSVIDVKAISK